MVLIFDRECGIKMYGGLFLFWISVFFVCFSIVLIFLLFWKILLYL